MKKRTQNKKVIKKDARKRLIILLLIFVSIASFLFIWVDSVIEDCKSKWTPIFDVCPALVRDDLSLCEEIINKDSTKEYLVVNCKEAINAIRIIRYNDIETCNKIEDKYQKDSCLAYVNKDIVKCKNARDYSNPDRIEEEALCRAFVNDDVKECDLVKGEKRVSTIAPDQPESPYEDCLDSFYTKKAIESKDKTYCEKIISLEAKGECLAAVTGKTSYCGLVKEYRCNCILSQATE